MPHCYQIVGVLNVTPDSYYDGGEYADVAAAVERAAQLIKEGADIIEVGGESTGPGSKDVAVEEELRRVLPVLDAIRGRFPQAALSIDTHKSRVAAAALERGVAMINDVTAGRGDPDMFSVLRDAGAKLVLMYAKDLTPRTTARPVKYTDVIEDIYAFLEGRIAAAEASGIPRDRIVIDPGMGHFVSSDPRYSFQIIARLRKFADLAPVFLSPSRKSFLAGKENLAPQDRLPGTIVASAMAVMNGATYIRTHDIAAVRRGIEVAMQIVGGKEM